MTNNAPLRDGDLEIPTAEEIFNKPHAPAPPLPPAWAGDSIAVELADRERARLMANAMFDPPITEQEIEKYSGRFKIPKRQAEKEIRDRRAARHAS